MELKFTFLSLGEPYVGTKATYYRFDAVLEGKYCSVETSKQGYDELLQVAPNSLIRGNFNVKPSYNRKVPELVFVSVVPLSKPK